ncbi:MAG: 50S ribosomal protein L44e [Candidatus Hodarchaeales archaeon]
MKIPATMSTYCPKCRKHSQHKVKIEKVRQRGGGMSRGTRVQARHVKGYGNKGRYSRKAISQRNMTSKTSQKVDLRLECSECKSWQIRSRPRTKRAELLRS